MELLNMNFTCTEGFFPSVTRAHLSYTLRAEDPVAFHRSATLRVFVGVGVGVGVGEAAATVGVGIGDGVTFGVGEADWVGAE